MGIQWDFQLRGGHQLLNIEKRLINLKNIRIKVQDVELDFQKKEKRKIK